MDIKMISELPPWQWPEDADELFLTILEDDKADASDRLLAAGLAGDFTVVSDRIADVLMSIVQDMGEPEDIRGQAAISLGPALEYADEEGFDFAEDMLICEETFNRIQAFFYKLYLDASVPENVRRKVMEASIRAPQDWHEDAVRASWAGDNTDWKLTAIFSMRWIGGFDQQILEALASDNSTIHYHAVCAAGNWELDGAWPHISEIVRKQGDDKELLLAAIEAVVCIRPQEAGELLVDLTYSDDQDIVDAAHEAMAMAQGLLEDDFDDWDD